MSNILMPGNKKKMTIDQAIYGATQAIREGCDCTDVLVVVCNRRTGEFKLAIHPTDGTRALELVQKSLDRLRKMRNQTAGSGIIH